MLSNEHSHTVGAGITSPGTQKDQPYKENTILNIPGLIHVGKHDCHVNDAKKGCHDLLCMVFGIRKHIDSHNHDQHKNQARHSICICFES